MEVDAPEGEAVSSLWDEAENIARVGQLLDQAEVMATGYADALIEIASTFATYGPDPDTVVIDGVIRAVPNGCGYCHVYFEQECWSDCPGLLARRKLGVG